MSGQRRWYAPMVRTWTGRVTSRRGAMFGGTCATTAALLSVFVALTDPDPGPVTSMLRWAMVAIWSLLAYRLFAHAAFNTTGKSEGPKGGA